MQNIVLYFNMFRGHYNIVCRIFCTRMEFTKKIVMSVDFAGVEITKTCLMERHTGCIIAIQLIYFLFISDGTIYQNKS